MADGRDIVASLVAELNENKGKIVEVLTANQEALQQIIDGFDGVQKKFYLRTQGGTDAANECVDLFKELLAALGGGDAQSKFEAFAGPANTLIKTAANWTIKMT